jgi:hypothetical protein
MVMLAYHIDAHASTNKRINHSQSKNPIITLKLKSLNRLALFSLALSLFRFTSLSPFRARSQSKQQRQRSAREGRSLIFFFSSIEPQYTCTKAREREQLARVSLCWIISRVFAFVSCTHSTRNNEHKKVMVRYW